MLRNSKEYPLDTISNVHSSEVVWFHVCRKWVNRAPPGTECESCFWGFGVSILVVSLKE